MQNLPKQIIGSFEDIGKDIVKQTAQVPVDVAGKAMESLGLSKTSAGTQVNPQPSTSTERRSEDTWDTIDNLNDEKSKKSVAREALAALVNRKTQNQDSVWAKNEKEKDEKKEMREKQEKIERMNMLPTTGSKRPKGDLFGAKAKKTKTERGRDIKSE